MNEAWGGTLLAPRMNEVAERIEACVRRRLGGRVCDFQAVVQEGGIMLRGRTRTYYAKQLVQHMAMEVGGVPIVANRIEVS
jgi:osmotically-inducible protein OsmY